MKIVKISLFLLSLTTVFVACQKEYSLEGVNLNGHVGTWQFNDSAKLYAGNIDTAYIETTATTKTLHLKGPSNDGTQTFELHLYATDSFTVGTYKASLFQSDFEYFTQAKTLYQADQFIGEFIVTVTSIGSNKITGTFSGVAQDSIGNIKNITLGQFTATINLAGNGTGGGGGTATGSLGATSGVCTPAALSGTFTQGVALTSTNTVQLTVNVATTGSYTISTNSVNGVVFTGTGSFTTTGVQNVILTGTGTPTNSGSQTYTVTFGSSSCTFPVTYTGGLGAAVGTLGATAGACTPVSLAGTYTQGTALTASNTVQVTVNITAAGTYNITTNTVNGVNFSKSGTFTTTGVQTVTLTGSGTPLNSGSQTFTVTFGVSTCTFSITFGAGTVLDYFPLTLNSNWTYGYGTAATDSVFKKVITYAPTFSGNTYSTIAAEQFPVTGSANDSEYYRKPGGDYYTYINVQSYFGFDGPGTPTNGEFIFLKDNVPQGTTWNSPTFSGPFSGVTYSISIKLTIKEKGVAAPVGAFNFSDVIKVTYEYFVNGSTSGYIEEKWFARGVGLVNYFDNSSPPFMEKIARYQVF